MRILIYGAGVIGSIYAVLMSEAGYDVTVLARGKRLTDLLNNGLRYYKNGKVETANIMVIDKLEDDDKYDYIFLPVRTEQLKQALYELKSNKSPNIVTMVNTLEKYEELEKICGGNRLIPAFPGAGGSIDNGILNASLTPKIIQPTTFGELGKRKTNRTAELSEIFRRSRIPYQIVPDMHNWQISHLGMVVPIADVIIFFVLCLVASDRVRIWPIFTALALDCVLSFVCCALFTRIYHSLYVPRNMLLIYEDESALDLKFKMDARRDKYSITEVISVKAGLPRILSAIDRHDASPYSF